MLDRITPMNPGPVAELTDDVPYNDTTKLEERMKNLQLVQALADALIDKRQAAIEYRTSTGIEQDWKEDEEFYQAVDSANPEGESHVGKPVSADGGPIGIQGRPGPGRSTVFIPITRAYVDAASARISDMLLPTDDSPWSIKPTPVRGKTPAAPAMQPMPMQAEPGAMPPMDAGQMPPGLEQMPQGAPPMGAIGGDAVTAPPTDDGADAKAKRATEIICDWHIECQWHAEMRKVLEDAALLGTGILKGPFPMVKTSYKYEVDPATGQGQVKQLTEIKPVSKRIDPRNFWCCPTSGEDVQNGSYTWEFDQIGARGLAKLKQDTRYIAENIDKVLKEGPGKAYEINPASAEKRTGIGENFPIWYFYGDIDHKTLVAAGIPEEDFDEDCEIAIPAIITMVNDTVVLAALNPLENGGFPYDIMPWQRRTGMVWGKGVARQMRTPQRQLNAAERADMDNGGLTSGPMWGIRDKWIKPIDGQNTLTPRKGFRMTEDAPPNAKIGDALSFINIQSNGPEQAARIQRAKQNAEDATGLPMLMQGQQGSAPDTVGGMTILNNNGSTVLRRIARNCDDYVTERHIRRYYFWLMANPGNDDAKGDFQIDARGSTALVERDLQNQSLNQLAPMLMNHPDVSKDRLVEELMKANRLDPKRVMLTDEEKKQRDSQQAPPPLPLLLAQANNQSREKIKAMDLQFAQSKTEHDQQIAEARLKKDYEAMLGELALRHNTSADSIKAMLASTTMRLNMQAMLSDAGRAPDRNQQVLTPPTEPVGQAPDGEAFQK